MSKYDPALDMVIFERPVSETVCVQLRCYNKGYTKICLCVNGLVVARFTTVEFNALAKALTDEDYSSALHEASAKLSSFIYEARKTQIPIATLIENEFNAKVKRELAKLTRNGIMVAT